MPYGDYVVKKRSSAVLALAFVIAASCGGATTPAGHDGRRATNAATSVPAARPPAPQRPAAASFGQILGSAKASEYKVTYTLGDRRCRGLPASSRGIRSRRSRALTSAPAPPGRRRRLDLFTLPDGTFMCFGGTGHDRAVHRHDRVDTALQQNPAALFQQSMTEHPNNSTACRRDASDRGTAGALL